ncbi:MAG: hypothetical protein FWE48_07685, partial [Coriobacteriia bacterium]|nr:hypothetical protein [Coriobacteriia bacterium]
DREVARIIKEGHDRACEILKREHEMLLLMGEELMKQETLEGEELDKVFATGKVKVEERVSLPVENVTDDTAS